MAAVSDWFDDAKSFFVLAWIVIWVLGRIAKLKKRQQQQQAQQAAAAQADVTQGSGAEVSLPPSPSYPEQLARALGEMRESQVDYDQRLRESGVDHDDELRESGVDYDDELAESGVDHDDELRESGVDYDDELHESEIDYDDAAQAAEGYGADETREIGALEARSPWADTEEQGLPPELREIGAPEELDERDLEHIARWRPRPTDAPGIAPPADAPALAATVRDAFILREILGPPKARHPHMRTPQLVRTGRKE